MMEIGHVSPHHLGQKSKFGLARLTELGEAVSAPCGLDKPGAKTAHGEWCG